MPLWQHNFANGRTYLQNQIYKQTKACAYRCMHYMYHSVLKPHLQMVCKTETLGWRSEISSLASKLFASSWYHVYTFSSNISLFRITRSVTMFSSRMMNIVYTKSGFSFPLKYFIPEVHIFEQIKWCVNITALWSCLRFGCWTLHK